MPMKKERPENAWVRQIRRLMVDQQAAMRKENTLNQHEARRLGTQIANSLKDNHMERVRKAGETIRMHPEAGELQEACWTLRGLHLEVGKFVVKLCYAFMEKQTKEREDL